MKGADRRPRRFVLGKDLRSDGHVRITKAEDWLVEGGTKESHEDSADIVNEFTTRLRKEGRVDAKTAGEILRDVLNRRQKTTT